MSIAHAPKNSSRTKIVCTLGPSVASPEKIKALMQAGMSLARINCSHGTVEDRKNLVQLVRDAASELGYFMPIMFDLQGPKIRLTQLREDLPLQSGQELIVATGNKVSDENCIFTTYPSFSQDVKPGERVLIDDGKIHLMVERVEDEVVFCRVENSGLLKSRKGMNLPNTKISAPCLSEKDLVDLQQAVELGADFVAVSFVRTAQDMVEVRQQAKAFGAESLLFISKIERPEALKHLISIINTSDGVMVARGDLGVEIGSHRVPMHQKEIIARANLANKFVITATQMLESMIELPVPTRAEASDVANAILDGTDACMLSAETASGAYPIASVKMMAKIAQEAESHSIYRYEPPSFARGSVHHIPDGISIAANNTANLMNAQLLIAFTNSGRSALLLSKKHPNTLIVGATIHEHIARRLNAFWGIYPILIKEPKSVEDMFHDIKEKIMELELVRHGDVAVLTTGYPLWSTGTTNLLRVMEIH